MRPHFPRLPAACQPAAGAGRSGSERAVAQAMLGAGHPLVRLLRRFETAREQVAWVTALQAGGAIFSLGASPLGLPLIVAAGVVQVALTGRILFLRMLRRELCLQLIVEGRATLPLSCVEVVCRRLRHPRTSEQLAGALEDLVETATRPRTGAGPRPVVDVGAIRAVANELREVAALLRAGRPGVRGVALVQLLLTSGATPLYRPEVEPLRRELGRARYLLATGRRP